MKNFYARSGGSEVALTGEEKIMISVTFYYLITRPSYRFFSKQAVLLKRQSAVSDVVTVIG